MCRICFVVPIWYFNSVPIKKLNFIQEYNSAVGELDLDWDIYGLIDHRENIYSLTDDAKIVGRVFELLSAPAVREVASKNDYLVTPAESQTIYPDFTLEKDAKHDNKKMG